MTLLHEDHRPIEEVREGMPVINAAGADLGKVSLVRMGDPEPVTGAGQARAAGDDVLATAARAAFGGARLPRQVAERYLLTGYLAIDCGSRSGHAYVGAEQIEAVRDGTVHIRATRDGLVMPT